jgi:F-type H+-transporting ATPase subunit a
MELNISLAPEVLFNIGSLPITNSFFWFFCLSWLFIITAIIYKSRIKLVPGKMQNFIELLISSAYEFVESIIGPGKKAERVFPLVATIFFFIVTANLLVYIPGQAAISLNTAGGAVPLFRAVVADYGLVFLLTIMAIIIVQLVAIISAGPFNYLGRFINFRSPMKFFLGIMELISELAKIISLSFRLFGNIFAGEVLGAVMLFLAPFFVPLPFLFLGLLTAVVQAFVFAVLTLVFISMASEMGEEANV